MCPKSLRRLKNRFYFLHFFMAVILSQRWDSPLLPHQPAKRLCVTCIMFLFGTEFGLCVLLQCAGCFFGAFHRIEKQPALVECQTD